MLNAKYNVLFLFLLQIRWNKLQDIWRLLLLNQNLIKFYFYVSVQIQHKGHPGTEYLIPTKYKKNKFTSTYQYSGLSITKNTEVFLLIILSLVFWWGESLICSLAFLWCSTPHLMPFFEALFHCYWTINPLTKIKEHNK